MTVDIGTTETKEDAFRIEELEDVGDLDVDLDMPEIQVAAPKVPPKRRIIQHAASTDYVMQQMSTEQVARLVSVVGGVAKVKYISLNCLFSV